MKNWTEVYWSMLWHSLKGSKCMSALSLICFIKWLNNRSISNFIVNKCMWFITRALKLFSFWAYKKGWDFSCTKLPSIHLSLHQVEFKSFLINILCPKIQQEEKSIWTFKKICFHKRRGFYIKTTEVLGLSAKVQPHN